MALSVIIHCYFTGALLMVVSCRGEEFLYNLLIKCQLLGSEDLQKHFLASFFFLFPFSPYLRQEGQRGLELSYCPFPRSNKALVNKARPLEGRTLLWRKLLACVFQNDYLSSSPAWNNRGFFSCHHENLVGLLEGSARVSSKTGSPGVFNPQTSHICPPSVCQNHQLRVPTSFWLQ